jgi:hypothetical protein
MRFFWCGGIRFTVLSASPVMKRIICGAKRCAEQIQNIKRRKESQKGDICLRDKFTFLSLITGERQAAVRVKWL